MTLLVGVTPLIGAIFAKTIVHRSIVTQAKTTAVLAPMQDQFTLLNTGFMMTAYGSLWHGQKLPAFTTTDSAILPFKIDEGRSSNLKNVTWTSTTTMYTTTLDCKVAAIHDAPDGKVYDNGKGCKPSYIGELGNSRFGGVYISYYLDYNDWSLAGRGCAEANNSHTFLAVWGSSVNVTALFCEPTYWSQHVNATVEIPSMSVSNIVPLAEPEQVTQDSLNITNFEYMLGTGSSIRNARADISDTVSVIDQKPQLLKLGIDIPTDTNMVGFAMGGNNLDPEEYLNASILASSFERAHKLLFAIAFASLLSTDVSNADPRMGLVNGVVNTVVIVRILALIVEISLGLVVVFALALLYLSWSRGSGLLKDPASLTDIMSMITPDALSLKQTHDAVGGAGDELRISIISGKFHVNTKSTCQEQPMTNPAYRPPKNDFPATANPTKQIVCTENLIRPLEMRLPLGLGFITVLLFAIITLVVLEVSMRTRHGLPLPSRIPAVTQLLLNYIPIIFAAFIEPIWILLNRLICVLQPFESLRTGHAKASTSVDVRYTSLPPQLVVWRALQGRHYLLAAVCAVGISANLLAVAFSGLLTTDIIPMEYNGSFTMQYLPILSNTTDEYPGSDHMYAAQANFSKKANRPAWVARDMFFLPFSLNFSGAYGEIQSYKAVTHGFGVDLRCRPVSLDTNAFILGHDEAWNLTQQSSSGRNVTCGHIHAAVGGQNKSAASLEVFQGVQPLGLNTTKEDGEICESTIIAGFIRANLTVLEDNIKTDFNLNDGGPPLTILDHKVSSSLWLACQPTLHVAPYEVLVDQKGNVQNYTRKAPYITDQSQFLGNDLSSTSLLGFITKLLSLKDTQPYWHNDTFADNWFGYFVKTLTNSTDPVDPALPVPSFEFIGPVVEDMYSRLFAIILGLHLEWFSSGPPDSLIEGKILVPESRVFMSRSMFVIAVTLLFFNIIIAIAYYTKRPKVRLSRLPNTVASIFQLFEGSGLVAERAAANGWQEDWRFGYGKFVGTDGEPHIGIERRPFVVLHEG